MAAKSTKAALRPEGCPDPEHSRRGCIALAQVPPQPVYITCSAQIHNPSEREKVALLQVFKNYTLAAAWMLRDIGERHPEERFKKYRKTNSTHYITDGIANAIDKAYRTYIRSRFALNSQVFDGLCAALASNVSGYLQQMAEAQQKGLLHAHAQSGAYVIPVGKYAGNKLRDLGRKTIRDDLYHTPTRAEYEEALRHLSVMLGDGDEDQAVQSAAAQYTMSFGPRRGKKLETMRAETWRRLKLLTERRLECIDEWEEARNMAGTYLAFTPPRFPSVRGDGLSSARRDYLQNAYVEQTDSFGALPTVAEEDELETDLSADEFRAFKDLQRAAAAATNEPVYLPVHWKRADAVIRHRECALVYDLEKRRYLFLAYVLADTSRHKRKLVVKGDLYDVNNPNVKLGNGTKPSGAMLFELEFDTHQQRILDQARNDADRWKARPTASGGSIRSASLRAHYSEERRSWWFEVQLAVGIKPSHTIQPENIVGVHVDPPKGMFVTVVGLDGVPHNSFHLDEHAIAMWLRNQDPEQQAQLTHKQRTPKEVSHRLADALVAICQHHNALLAVEDINYRKSDPIRKTTGSSENTRAPLELLPYKLARAHLPPLRIVKGIAPKRDCSRCGYRSPKPEVQNTVFVCPRCGYTADRHTNTATEVARRALWAVAQKSVALSKSSHSAKTTK